MIELTRLNGTSVVVNAELIETVEATPDTVITMITGRKLIVRDQVTSVVDRVVQYRQLVGLRSREATEHSLAPEAGIE